MEITLQSISENSQAIFYELRWNGTICCPECGSVQVYNPEPGKLHICKDCHTRFSDTSGTMFHSTKLSLSKWLYCIYLFLSSSRGVSSYSIARNIGVSQKTAWSMLMKLRGGLHRDIKFSSEEQVAIDEVYLGANWKYKPAFKKYKEAGEPPKHWGLKDKEKHTYYKKRFMELASEDKMPVLGMVSLTPQSIKICLVDIPSSERKESVREEICTHFEDVLQEMFVGVPQTIITDQSHLYDFLDDFLDHNNRHKFRRVVCRHDLNRYGSEGLSSNRIEAAFSHLRRMWRGVYTKWSRKYNQMYLDEFCFRYNNPLSDKSVITNRIREFFKGIDQRCLLQFQ